MAASKSISIASLKELLEQNPTIPVLDVRTPAEFQEVRTLFAKLTPLESLKPKLVAEELGLPISSAIYFFCKSGTRARLASEKFEREGFESVYVVEGGVDAWDAAGYPVLRGHKVISLERQVRIAAGSLVLIGLILGFTVDIGFVGISGFVGAGLVFAGVTDTCGMGLLLARMPWNQAGADSLKALSS